MVMTHTYIKLRFKCQWVQKNGNKGTNMRRDGLTDECYRLLYLPGYRPTIQHSRIQYKTNL